MRSRAILTCGTGYARGTAQIFPSTEKIHAGFHCSPYTRQQVEPEAQDAESAGENEDKFQPTKHSTSKAQLGLF